MIDYRNMIKVELKYNIFKSLEFVKYPIEYTQILEILNIYDYEKLPDNIYDFVRFSRSWNHNYKYTAIYKNSNTSRYTYIHFNIILKQNQD